MKTLDSRKLFYFAEVARAGSFRLGALSLGVSQSLLTRQIQSLEEDLGVVLFQRGVRSTRPTEAGELLLERCQKILRDLEETRAVVSSVGTTPTGSATLAVLTSFSASFSAGLLNSIRRTLPNVNVRITEGTSRYVEERILSGQADVGVLIKRPLAEKFVLETLLDEEFRLFGREIPPGKTEWSLREVAELPLVLPLPPHGTRRLIDAAARQQGAKLTARYEVDSPYLIRDLMLSSGVFGILPATSMPAEREAGTLQMAPIVDPPKRTIVIGTLQGKPLSSAARAVAHHVRRIVAAGAL